MNGLSRRLSAVCLLCCAVGPVVVKALRIGDEDRTVLQTAEHSSRHKQKQKKQKQKDPPEKCVPQMAREGVADAQNMVTDCIAKSTEPHTGPGRNKDKCECVDDGIDKATKSYKDSNCRDMARQGLQPFNFQKKMFGCPSKKRCDEIKADRKHDKCMDKLHECMKKQGIDFDTSFMQKKGSLLELDSNSTAHHAVHGGDDDDDDDDDGEEKDEVCKCAEAAMDCVKMAALDTDCKEEKEEEYRENLIPQKDNICRKKDKGDDGAEDEDSDEAKSRNDPGEGKR